MKLFKFKGLYSIIFYIALLALLWYLIIPRTSIFYRKYFYRPHIGQLNKIDVVMKQGDRFHLYVIGLNKRVYFSSTDISVADVNIFGTVYGLRPGTTIIKAKVDGKVLKCRIRVVEINKSKLKLKVGDNYKVKIKGIKLGIKWTSDNKEVAIVNSSGKITAIGKGTVLIKAKVKGITLSCKVTVSD